MLAGDQTPEIQRSLQRGGHQVLASHPRHGRAAQEEAAWGVPAAHRGAGRLPRLLRLHHGHAGQ